MNTEELASMLDNNMCKLLDKEFYKRVLDRGNNLIRYDVLNRVIIEMQYSGAFDIRTEEEWYVKGRRVIKGSKPIYIMIPKYKHKYIDSETNEEVDIDDLSLAELNEAVQLGVVYKEEQINGIYTVPVYDIRQTNQLIEGQYKINRPILNTGALLQLLHDITGAELIASDRTEYNLEDNKVYIKKQEYEELANEVIDIVLLTKQEILDEPLIKESLAYALSTLFKVNRQVDFIKLDGVSQEDVVNMLYTVDSIICNIVDKLKFLDKEDNTSALENIQKIYKVEAILDMMESNLIYRKIKGI